jgi:5'-deoxynucleotidase YfbR-like HD superfamily hydrolase
MTYLDRVEFEQLLKKYGDVSPLVLSSQIRYNNRIRLKDEDLAQHSYYVAYNIMSIGHDFNIKQEVIEKAVCRAIIHDLDEQFTSDIPHDCKVEFPELKQMVSKIGLDYIKKRADFATKYFEDYSTKEDLANLLVDTGDAISVLQYVNRERLLGNITKEMKLIYIDTKKRLNILFKKLKNYKEE